MSGLFKVKMPAPDPEIAEMQKKQEARLEQEEMQKRKQLQAKGRARRTGGQRMLLSEERGAEARTGLDPLSPEQ
jgi:hypothetical protein